ncbi:MAG: hypothetical protein KDI82_01190 [Gammaproteobacteria bacterium]|nr:hypothetical protein [Gammaproteobacteria bacterium]
MSATATPADATAGHERPPLDDVMLAMDVVDTLRRRERLVARELDEAGREQDLSARLRRIYEQQGIEVPDHVIEQAVAALKEDRFTYKPAGSGLARRLALIYVKRGRWGKWVGGGVGAAALAAAVNYFAFIAPDRALPDELAAQHQVVMELAAVEPVRELAQAINAQAQSALVNDDTDAAKKAIARLGQLETALAQEFVVQVVNRPGERSGVWRIPDINEQARNYYVIVEAISPGGERLRVPVTSEESGETSLVDAWGLRVDEATFESVRRDKADDGIIENDRFGYKKRGHLEPDYERPTSGGAITQW